MLFFNLFGPFLKTYYFQQQNRNCGCCLNNLNCLLTLDGNAVDTVTVLDEIERPFTVFSGIIHSMEPVLSSGNMTEMSIIEWYHPRTGTIQLERTGALDR